MVYSDKMLKAAQEFKNTNQKSKLTKGVTVSEIKPKEEEQKTYVYQKNADGTRTLVRVTTPTSSTDVQKTYVYQKNTDGTRTLKSVEEPTVTKSTIFTGGGKALVGSQQSKNITSYRTEDNRGMSIDTNRFKDVQSAAQSSQTISNRGMSIDTTRTMNKSGFGLSTVEQLNRVPKIDTTKKIVSGNEYASYLKDKGAVDYKIIPLTTNRNIFAQISSSGYSKGVETKSKISIREDRLQSKEKFSNSLSHELGHYDQGISIPYGKQNEDYARQKAREQTFLVPGNSITGSLLPMSSGIIQVGGKSQIEQSQVPKFTDIISKQTTSTKPQINTGTHTETKKVNFLQSLGINFASAVSKVNKNTVNINVPDDWSFKKGLISEANKLGSGFLLTDDATRNVNFNNPVSSLGVGLGLGLTGGPKVLKYGFETSGQALKAVNLKTTGFLAEKVSPFFKTGLGQFTTATAETLIISEGIKRTSDIPTINKNKEFFSSQKLGFEAEQTKVDTQPFYKQLGYGGLGIFTADSSVRLAGEEAFIKNLDALGISKEEQGNYLKDYRKSRTAKSIAEPAILLIGLSKGTEIMGSPLISSGLIKAGKKAGSIAENKIANFVLTKTATLPKFAGLGAFEGGLSELYQERIRQQDLNIKQIGFSAGAGAVTAGVFGTAIVALPLSPNKNVQKIGTVTKIVGYTTDPYEYAGDLLASGERKILKKGFNIDYGTTPKIFKTTGPTPVFTFNPILTPTETKTNIAGIIKNPTNTQIQSIFDTPIKTPSNIFSFTSVSNPVTTPNNVNNPISSKIYNPIMTNDNIPININNPITNNINTMINIPVVTPMPRIPPMLPMSLDLGGGGYGGGKGKNKAYFTNEAVYAGQIFKNTLGGTLKPLQSYETKRINKQIKELKILKKDINKHKIKKPDKKYSQFKKLVGL